MLHNDKVKRNNPSLEVKRKNSFTELWQAIQVRDGCPDVGVIDVGAGNGLCPYLKYFPGFSHLYYFECDYRQVEQLSHQLKQADVATKTIIQSALAQQSGSASLCVTKSSQNTSLLKPSSRFAERYRISGLEPVELLDVSVSALDEFKFDHISIVIKVDAQGADLDILRGASNLLAEKVDVVIVETCFTHIYENQPLFSDIVEYLSKFGLIFYGYLGNNHYSTKLVNQYKVPTRERLVWTDSIFIKDPIENRVEDVSKDKIIQLIVSLIALEYFDLAFEIALKYTPEFYGLITHFVESQFSVNSESLRAEILSTAHSISSDNAAWIACNLQSRFSSYGVPSYLPKR